MISNPIQDIRAQTIVELQHQIRRWEHRGQQAATNAISTGCDVLDSLFPGGGIRRGSLVEWIGQGEASGAGALSLLVCRQFGRADRPAILVEGSQPVYPVALTALGWNLASLVVVRTHSQRDALWACEESLRCKAVDVVWARVEQLTSLAFRRLQLAAEESGGVGFLVRSAAALKQPSWADVRLLVAPRPTGSDSLEFQVSVAYSRGQTMRSTANIAVDGLRGTFYRLPGGNDANDANHHLVRCAI
jgi:protein ImuA